MTDKEKELLGNLQFEIKTKRKLTTELPADCGITLDMIPKYCYYAKPCKFMGEHFVIDRHPKLNVRCWCTQSDRKLSLAEKFEQLLKKLEELDQL